MRSHLPGLHGYLWNVSGTVFVFVFMCLALIWLYLGKTCKHREVYRRDMLEPEFRKVEVLWPFQWKLAAEFCCGRLSVFLPDVAFLLARFLLQFNQRASDSDEGREVRVPL